MVGNSTRAARAGRESVEERKQRLQHIMCRYADTRLEFRKNDCLPKVRVSPFLATRLIRLTLK